MGATAVVAQSTISSTAGELPADNLPTWANEQIDAAVARYLAWKGKDQTVAFTFMTDVHSWLSSKPSKPNFANSRYHALFAQAAADRAACDFLVEGGDHDYDLNCKSDKEAFARMAVTESVYHDYAARPVLFCLGNHDHGPYLGRKTRPISSEQFGETFNALAEQHGFKLTFGSNKSWGYYDVPGKNFRAIFCNTSDESYYGLSQDQIAFVSNALSTLPKGWTSALFCHFCILTELGHWKGADEYTNRAEMPGTEAFKTMLEEYAMAHPAAFAGCFCGDSHFDGALEVRRVNWTTSQGYGGMSPRWLTWGTRMTRFDRAKTMLFELVAIKPSKKTFRLFRVGAGGEACDRTCYYGLD